MDLPSETDPREYLAMKHDQTSRKDLFALFSALAPERKFPVGHFDAYFDGASDEPAHDDLRRLNDLAMPLKPPGQRLPFLVRYSKIQQNSGILKNLRRILRLITASDSRKRFIVSVRPSNSR